MTKSLDRPSRGYHPEKWWSYYTLKPGDIVLIWDQESDDDHPELVEATVVSNDSRNGEIIVEYNGQHYFFTPRDHDRYRKEYKH